MTSCGMEKRGWVGRRRASGGEFEGGSNVVWHAWGRL
jgi:hypothetical protein